MSPMLIVELRAALRAVRDRPLPRKTGMTSRVQVDGKTKWMEGGGGTTEWIMSRINIYTLDRYHFVGAISHARTLAIADFSECTRGSDGILTAMEAVRRAVLSPDDLLGYNLLFVRARFSCRNMPSDNNVNLTQVHSTKTTPERRL